MARAVSLAALCFLLAAAAAAAGGEELSFSLSLSRKSDHRIRSAVAGVVGARLREGSAHAVSTS
jgi:hypothetical protein